MEQLEYDKMRMVENTHWWFVARREIVLSLFNEYLSTLEKNNGDRGAEKRICDLGCGMGVMLKHLSQYGDVYGMDMESAAVDYCRELLKTERICSDEEADRRIQKGYLPGDCSYHDGEMDVVFAMDVLEHIDDDTAAVECIRRILRDGGMTVITVPALKTFWSFNDVFVHHKRRYNSKMLRDLFEENGFEVLRCTYFNFLLSPAIWVVRKLKNLLRIRKDDLTLTVHNSLPNRLLYWIFSSEKKHLLSGRSYPWGVSLVLIGRKK